MSAQLKIGELARLIVESELRERTDARPAAFAKVIEKLHHVLVPMVGELGFGAVVKRAIWLASKTDGLQGFPPETVLDAKDLAALDVREGPERTSTWISAVVCQSLSLLESFLGDKLTFKLVERAFPQAVKAARASSQANGDKSHGQ